jgi:hypothetical protein
LIIDLIFVKVGQRGKRGTLWKKRGDETGFGILTMMLHKCQQLSQTTAGMRLGITNLQNRS